MKSPETPSMLTVLREKIILANSVLILLMVLVVSLAGMIFIEAIFEDWKSAYLPFVAVFIGFEALYSFHKTIDKAAFSSERLQFHFVEWFVILLVLRLLLYLVRDPAQLLTDILLWDEAFFETFFTGEYILLIAFAVLIWFITLALNDPAQQLVEDMSLLNQEKMGYTFNDRSAARKRLIGTIFILGGVQLFFTALITSNIEGLTGLINNPRWIILLLILYFLLGFILLAVNQYSLQKARWYLADFSVADDVAHTWLIYGILFLVIISIVTVLLPTEYIIGFFPLIRALGRAIVYLSNLLGQLLIVLLSLIGKLFGRESDNTQAEETTPEEPFANLAGEETTGMGQSASPTWMIIRSFIFWGIFIFLAYFSIRYYIQQHSGMRLGLKALPIKAWIKKITQSFHAFFSSLFNFSKKGLAAVSAGMQTLFSRKPVEGKKQITSTRLNLPIRIRIIKEYLALTQQLAEFGYAKKTTQTPLEYADQLIMNKPAVRNSIEVVTEILTAARYMRQEVRVSDLSVMRKACEAVQFAFEPKMEETEPESIVL